MERARSWQSVVGSFGAILASIWCVSTELQAQDVDPPELVQMGQETATLQQLDVPSQRELLSRLSKLGPAAQFSINPLLKIWQEADGRTDDRLLAGVLEVFRGMGQSGAQAATSLSEFLPHDSPVYWNRDQLEVTRLRAYLMVTLAEIGLPVSAYPHLLESLALVDEHANVVEVGSAAHALRSEGRRARQFIPYLVDLVAMEFAEEEFSVSRYSVDYPVAEATTPQLEALKTLAAICRPEDEAAVNLLQELASSPTNSRWDARARELAQDSLFIIRLR
jgi:hypothetical protein